jgi:hypothetical protein
MFFVFFPATIFTESAITKAPQRRDWRKISLTNEFVGTKFSCLYRFYLFCQRACKNKLFSNTNRTKTDTDKKMTF